MGILPTLYSSLFCLLSAESKITHIQEVLHQRLLDPPLNDKTEVPSLPTPSPTHHKNNFRKVKLREKESGLAKTVVPALTFL